MNGVMIFEGNKVEVFEFKNRVLFNPRHVAKCLELSDSGLRNYLAEMNENQAELIKNSDVRNKDFRKLNNAGEKFITESGVYKLIFKSRKDNAEQFQDWVTDEVLPTIRKTGGYVSNDDQFINTYLQFADESTKLMFKGTLETVRKQNELIASQKKTIVNQDAIISNVIKDDGLYAIGIVGKILKPYCNNMGAIKIFTYLRDNKILMNYPGTQKHNLPYDKYSHYFEVKYVDVNKGFHSFTESKTYFKGNGLKYLLNKLVQDKHMTSKSSEKVKETFSNMEGAI